MKIPNNSLVALDSMIFIYLFEYDLRYINKTKPLFEKIESGKIKGVTSVISLLETLSAPKLKGEKEKSDIFERFFYETPNLKTVEVDRDVAVKASIIRQENQKLRTPDSIQIATALYSDADYFLTNDINLKKVKIPPLKILTPSELNM